MADSDSSTVRLFEINGKPLHFFMRPCKERQDLRKIVEAHGGLLSGNRNAADIELYVAGDVCSNQEALPSMYVRECIRVGTLLDAASYRKEYQASRLSSADDADGKISDIEDNVAHNVKMEVQRHQTRRKYLLDEDMQIIAYVTSHGRAHRVQGSTLWKNMELLQVTPHSWQSMKQRFKTQIMPYINGYDVSDEVKRTIAALGSTVGSSRGPLPQGIPDLSDSDDEARPSRPGPASSCTDSNARLRPFAGATLDDRAAGGPGAACSLATAARAKHHAPAKVTGADDTAAMTSTPVVFEPSARRCSTAVAEGCLPPPASTSSASSRATIATVSSAAAAVRPAGSTTSPRTDGKHVERPGACSAAAGASDRTRHLLAQSGLSAASGSAEKTTGTDDSLSHACASPSHTRCIPDHGSSSSSDVSHVDLAEVELTQRQHGSSKGTASAVGNQVRKRTSSTSKQSSDCISSSTSSEDDFDRVLIAAASKAATGNTSRFSAASSRQSKRIRVVLSASSSPNADSITADLCIGGQSPDEIGPADPSPAAADADSPAASSLAVGSTAAALADATAVPLAVDAASLGISPGESALSGRVVESLIELISGDLKCSALEVVRTLYACNCDFKLAVQHLRSGSKGVFWSPLDDENIRQGRYDLLKGKYSNSDLIKRMEFLHRWDTS